MLKNLSHKQAIKVAKDIADDKYVMCTNTGGISVKMLQCKPETILYAYTIRANKNQLYLYDHTYCVNIPIKLRSEIKFKNKLESL